MDPTLLDTDILSEVLKQRNVQVRDRARQYLRSHGQFAFSAVTRFEIIRGYKELGATSQLARFATLCGHSLILPLADAVFDRAAVLWVLARQGAFPRGDADLLIAATAIESGYHLATGNTSDFSWIPGLQVEDWRRQIP